jgi:hypothetical protein
VDGVCLNRRPRPLPWVRAPEQVDPPGPRGRLDGVNVMATAQEIASFIRARRHWTHARVVVTDDVFSPYRAVDAPSADQLKQWILADSEFRALQLADWWTTPNGEAIAKAVELAVPQSQPEFGLWVDAMQAAARSQQTEGIAKAGRNALIVSGVGGLLWALSRAA